MLTQAKYEALIRDFLVELNHLWVNEGEESLRALPTFRQLNEEYLPELRDPACTEVQVLRTAFAYVDEFIEADRSRVMRAGYASYVTDQREGAGEDAPSA